MKILSAVTFSLCLVLGLGSASATTYRVELTGNDANSGLDGSPWRTLTKACAEIPADQGHIIQVGEGTFTEAGILTLRSGVSLIGAGSGKTKILVNHFFSLTDAVPNANPHVDTFPAHFVIQMNGTHQTLKGFALDGQDKRCHGGVFASWTQDVVFEDLHITNFRYCGLWVIDTHNTIIDNGGIGRICALHPSSTYEARNNLIFRTLEPKDIWGTEIPGKVSHNFFSNATPRGTNAMTGDPGITLAEGRLLRPPYYTVKPDSPLLNKGEIIAPVTDGFTGSAPDIGAIEEGVALTIPLALKKSDDE